jgi:molybdopterin-biosynthesis enzyme MoeA-like protein
VTGSEVFHRRIKDSFNEKIGKKIADLGSRVVKKLVVPDEIDRISQALLDLQATH